MSRPRGRAFTLIEMMVAVALMAMVLAMVGGIFLSVINTREKVQESLDKDKAGYGLLATLRRDLTGVYAYALGGPAFLGEDEEAGAGRSADRLRFVTTADVAVSEDGVKPRLVEVGYRVEKASDSDQLILYRRAGGLEGDPLKGGTYSGLYVGLHSLDIKYFDPEEDAWKDEWRQPKRLPQAVKVVLELSPDEREVVAAREEGREVSVSHFEMIVGIPAQAEPAEDTAKPEESPPSGENPGGAPAPTGGG